MTRIAISFFGAMTTLGILLAIIYIDVARPYMDTSNMQVCAFCSKVRK